MRKLIAIVSVLCLPNLLWADNITIGDLGIKSQGLGLNGSGIAIGQVEKYRAGKPDKDSAQYVHTQTNPVEVYAGTSVDSANSQFVTAIDPNTGDTDSHATQVAGVMIANGVGMSSLIGVAPQASLYSGTPGAVLDDQRLAVALNRIAGLPANPRAINISFGREAQPFIEDVDGDSHATQFVDWSARQHDVLYVVAGPEEGSANDIPGDNFNGITVAASDTFRGQFVGAYRQVAPFNITVFDAVGERTTIDLMAPGVEVRVTTHNNGNEFTSGTSYAAPHVAGAAALLHQYASNQITAGTPRWGNESHFHEVTKAILLNSADKLLVYRCFCK